MKIALDTFMHRAAPLPDVIALAARLGYRHVELSWREDFIPLFRGPRADRRRMQETRAALRQHDVSIASLVVLYRWASPDPHERATAVRHWRRAIEIAVEMGIEHLNSEFGGDFCGGAAEASEGAFWASLDEVVPLLEREGLTLSLEAHPGDFVERNRTAVDMITSVDSPHLRYLYCTPHTFHLGEDPATMIEHAGPVLDHVHIADTWDHRKSSGLRYIVNPIGAPVRVHQHLNIGEGEVDWDATFSALAAVGFDGIMSTCVFAWEERAVESCREMVVSLQALLERHFPDHRDLWSTR